MGTLPATGSDRRGFTRGARAFTRRRRAGGAWRDDGGVMAHDRSSQQRLEQARSWWVVGAWASLLLVLAGGLAGAAGLG